MARIRSVDFLPEIFKTDVNKEFLGATLDQLIQEPKLKKKQGYIGRRFGAGTNYSDSYLLESTNLRTNYQLEPGVVFTDDGKPTDAITYPGIIDALAVHGGLVNRHDRLFANETYSWDPLINFDKFINYGQYYWLPQGPDSVDVFSTDVAVVDDFDVTISDNLYNFSGISGDNPTITLVRGGTYNFRVNQNSGFWIQSEPGVDGTLNYSPNISNRNILGVRNNGENSGTIRFNVPLADAQTFYYNLTDIGTVDLATTARFDSINHRAISDFRGIDGITDLEGRTLVFVNQDIGKSEDLGWQRVGLYDNEEYDSQEYADTVYLDSRNERYSIFRIVYVRPAGALTDDDAYIKLVKINDIDVNESFTIGFGNEFSNRSFYKDSEGFLTEVPLLTAANDILYYQDGTTPNRFGVIRLVDQSGAPELNINEIIGKSSYTSPNGIQFTNGLKIKFTGDTNPREYSGNQYYVEGVGEAIQLVNVDDLITPDLYINNLDGSNNAPTETDYLTINRASKDLNPWTRSNRWFHIDVINKTAEYNNSIAVLDNTYRAKRPIIEFDNGLRLFNFGTLAVNPVDVIDFVAIDALSRINGSPGYNIDGYQLTQGSRVIFANDQDPEVKNRIYEVQLVDPDDDSSQYGTIINLIPTDEAPVTEDEVVLCRSGRTLAGNMYGYRGNAWYLTQQKTSVNQAPLFDIFDVDGYSFGDQSVYTSSTFVGSKLFSYKPGNTSINDPVLGFSLSYLNIDNLGDIVFENNLYNDEFVFVEGSASVQKKASVGFARRYLNKTDFASKTGWTAFVDRNWQRQVFTFRYAGSALQLDVVPRNDVDIPSVKVYVENTFVYPSEYTVTVVNGTTFINFANALLDGTVVQVKVISKAASSAAYYEIPNNLENNTFNGNASSLTLGTIRNHYNKLVENIDEFVGEINGINNTRDIGYLRSYGDVIIQHSSPIAPAAFFLRSERHDFFGSLDYCAKQYEKFKYQLLNWVELNETYGMTSAEIFDAAIKDINQGKTADSAFYWSDMLAFGGDYTETVNTVSVISTEIYNTDNVYDFTQSNSVGLLIYHNDRLLLKDTDYVVAADGPRFTLTFEPAVGDTITVREYNSTYGSFVPETPTKFGLYPRFKPRIYVDDTYQTPQRVIQGHDGSITVAFGDARDDLLLEFERRIYNNLKNAADVHIPLTEADVIPGQFRETEYSDSEITSLLAPELLNWIGWHKIDYKTQQYDAANEWTWNYSSATSRVDGQVLKGNWRGIYKYYYDTDRPHTHPWELIGLTEQPTWWEDEYGPAPYTSGNLVLWGDLEAGFVKDPENPRYVSQYVRPGLTSIIPVDSAGKLRHPYDVMVQNYTRSNLRKSWVAGDIGPAESAWRRSSNWPFAVQKLLALTKPAEYFALNIDLDRYTFNDKLAQYVYDQRYKLDVRNTELYSAANPKSSYINWIIESQRNLGVNSTIDLNNSVRNLDVRLCYRLGGFSDKRYLKIFTDKSSPDSVNTSLSIPDESYTLLLYKNQPFADLQYSSVMIQKTDDGYAVYGNSQTEAYFRILESTTDGNYETFTVGTTKLRIPKGFTKRVVRIPYGYTFNNMNSVVDFLVSYGKFLEYQGLIFADQEQNYVLDWGQMCQEFVYWANQGWVTGSIINLNPSARQLQFEKAQSVVDSLTNLAVNELPLDQNRQPLLKRDYAVTRIDNNFKFTVLEDKSLSYLRLRSTSYEHLLILDNTSIFNDLIYQPMTGIRQQRIRLDAFVTSDWNGQLDAQGFILNQDNVETWKPNQVYTKGTIVEYKNKYWSASVKIQPSELFNFEEWIKIDYNNITKGMLPNINSKANEITRYYNNSIANLESDADLLGMGITGFRRRDYLEGLNIDDISQVNVYSNLIQQKGTPTSARLFRGVEFDKEKSEYEIYENWAIQRATYGASDNNRYFELTLNKNQLKSNPSLIEIGVAGAQTDADQFVLVGDIYRQSIKHNNSNILPALNEDITDIALPTAGFVNSDDIDIRLFDLNDFSAINNNIDTITDGTYIWVAKRNIYDWDVYRTTAINSKVVNVVDNLNGTISVGFDNTHNLSIGDIVIIKNFNESINGAAKIQAVDDIKTIVVSGSLPEETTNIDGLGIGFKLNSARLAQPSDIVNTAYNQNLYGGDRIWSENNISGKWEVFKKSLPFALVGSQPPSGVSSSIGFGASAAQGLNGAGAIIGAPTYAAGRGGLYCYNRADSTYIFSQIANLAAADVAGYGNSVAFSTNWAVAGASATLNNKGIAVVIARDRTANSFLEWQVLTLPDGESSKGHAAEYGYDVEISEDEKWIYVGAPGVGEVYAYQFIEYQDQQLSYIATGNTGRYDLTNTVKVNNKDQIIVTVNGTQLATTEYNLISDILDISNAPTAGDRVTVLRKTTVDVIADGIKTEYDEINQLYTVDNSAIESFSVLVNGQVLRPYYDYSFNEDSSLTGTNYVNFAVAPAADSIITFRANDYYKYIDTVVGSAAERFGSTVKTTSNGQQVVIGAPAATNSALDNSGKVYVYERLVERFVVTDPSLKTYQTRRTLGPTSAVHVNSVHKRNEINNINAGYSILEILLPDSTLSRQTVSFTDNVTLTIGDKIDVDVNQFNLIQTLVLDKNNQGAAFGSDVSICRTDCSLYVSAPHDSHVLPSAGSVTRYVNSSRTFGITTASISNPTVNVGDSIRIDNIDVVFTNTSLDQVVNDINTALIPNVHARASSKNELIIEVVNQNESPLLSKMTVMPGLGTAFADLGLVPFAQTQVIRSPYPREYSNFGSSVHVDYSATNLIVGANKAATILPITYDNSSTTFDSKTTRNEDQIFEGGAVYTFDLLPSSTFAEPGKFVFGQQVYDPQIATLDRFGTAVNYTDGVLLVTSPGYDDSIADIGRVVLFKNSTNSKAWNVIRTQPVAVDTRLVKSLYIYNVDAQTVNTYLDFIDPVNGKLLGVVKQNLDFIGALDPANYNNQSTNSGVTWGAAQVGMIWWNTANCRYHDYHQDDIVYASKTWGVPVEGSTIDVYEWVESTVPPARYTGSGTIKNTTEYSTTNIIDASKTVVSRYYFWVKNRMAANRDAGKTLSSQTIANYIRYPQSSGIPYAALVNQNVVALYNVEEYLNDEFKSALHVEYSRTFTDNNVFVEYDLIRENSSTDFVPELFYKKLLDSLCGSDSLGNVVPDINLSITDRYGVAFRPRQSLFVNRFNALKAYITRANAVLLTYPFAEDARFDLLNSKEPIPTVSSRAWDIKLANLEELEYQDPEVDGAGYHYLVENDSNNNGLWTIYEVTNNYQLELVRVQSYNTSKFWDYTNWYVTGYSDFSKPAKIVSTYSELLTLTEDEGTLVKVANNSAGKWELYIYNTGIWERVGIQDGTVQINDSVWNYNIGRYGFDVEVFDSQYFDQEPTVELRQIIRSINEELFVGDFRIERNRLLIAMFNHILSEQGNVDWLTKTSLIDVDHKVRNLDQYAVYKKDNQDFVLDYINESKPYHVKIKEFLLRYEGEDRVDGNVYDYDCPSAYSSAFNKFISPVLDDDIAILETDQSNFEDSEPVWSTRPWADWYNNHKLSIDKIVITNGGVGYTLAPLVTVVGESDETATARAFINEDGSVDSVVVVNPGRGYRTTPTVEFSGGNGTGAVAVVYTQHDLVRSIKTTLKYDRYEYTTQIVDWEPSTVYNENQLVRFNDLVYRIISADGSTASDVSFDPELHELVPASELSGLDRTQGFYVPDVNKPGLDLALLIDGLDYPGVQVKGLGFDENTGYDIGNFDVVPFDNIDIGLEGFPTYSQTLLDTQIFTSFTGTYVGVDLSGIDAVQALGTSVINTNTSTVSDVNITEVGRGYSVDAPPLITFSEPNPNINATATAITDGNQVTTINVNDSGFGYITPPAVVIISADPTPGVRATANPIVAGGQVSDVSMINLGSGYQTTPSVVFSDPPSVASARATMEVTALDSTGSVQTVNITNPGSAYTSAPSVTVTDPPDSVQAEATAQCCTIAHKIASLTPTQQGYYYSSAPAVTIDPPNETAVQAVAGVTTSGGVVTAINIINEGALYDTPPGVTITPAAPTNGIRATATATLDTTTIGFDGTDSAGDGFDAAAFDTEGGVGTITVTLQGSGYTVAPIVTISAPDISGGRQATATATVNGDTAPLYANEGYVVSIAVTDSGSGYTTTPTVSIALPDTQINHGTGATATAILDDDYVLQINVTNGGQNYDILPTITIDAPTSPTTATATAIVSNGVVTGFTVTDRGWGYSVDPAVSIAAPDVTPTTAVITSSITGDKVTGYSIVDPGAGYIQPPTLTLPVDPAIVNDIATGTAVLAGDRVIDITVTNPGANYSTLPTITISQPTGNTTYGSGATATANINNNGVVSVTVDNPGSGYTIAPTVTIASPTRNRRRATGNAIVSGSGIIGVDIDDAGDGYLTVPSVYIGPPSNIDPDVDIVGGKFIDVYSSHAPEELVPGSTFDTLDFRVYTRPGYDYSGNGHGFAVKSIILPFVSAASPISFAELIDNPAALIVYNATTGTRIYETRNYTVDWNSRTITVTSGASLAEDIKIFVYDIGGGNQIYRNSYPGSEVGNRLVVPVAFDDILDALILVNGKIITGYTYAQDDVSSTVINFNSTYTSSDYINVALFAENPAEDSTLVQLGYSFPDTEIFDADESTTSFLLSGNIDNKTRENIIVELNGRRLRPAEGTRHIGDGSTVDFNLPLQSETGTSPSSLGVDDVVVYLNQQRLISGTDYTYTPGLNYVTFIEADSTITPPGIGDTVDIYATENAEYYLGSDGSSSVLNIVTGSGISLITGDVIAVTTWHDVREQDVLTQVYKGPTTVVEATKELFDSFGFDFAKYDETAGVESTVNLFSLDRAIVNSDRLWVTLNRRRLLPGTEYGISTDGTILSVAGGSLGGEDVLAITSFTNSVVPRTMAFRIFKDMRDNTAVYRITKDSETFLTQELKWTDDTIYVNDASKLGEPKLNAAVFGVIEINGERITYRNRNLTNNTVSGLRRGTAGTGMQRYHDVASVVSDLSRGQLLDMSYQTQEWSWSGTFVTGNVVKVGLNHYIAIQNVPEKTDITNSAYWKLYDEIWYEQGIGQDSTLNTASNGIALQQQNTVSARFLRGE